MLRLNWKDEYFSTSEILVFYLPTIICTVGENLS